MLALALGGRSVAEWKRSISEPEFEAWLEFYKRQPFDDYARFARPAAMVAQMASRGPFGSEGVEMLSLLRWLAPEQSDNEMTDADMATMKAFGYNKKGG